MNDTKKRLRSSREVWPSFNRFATIALMRRVMNNVKGQYLTPGSLVVSTSTNVVHKLEDIVGGTAIVLDVDLETHYWPASETCDVNDVNMAFVMLTRLESSVASMSMTGYHRN